MNISRFILLIALSLTIAGCASTHAGVPHGDPSLGQDPAEATLAEAATSVSKSLVNLDEMQKANSPPSAASPPVDPASYGMSNLVTIDWNGPIEPLLTQIADATGYQINVLGKAPAIPILVTVIAKNRPIGEVLRDAGYQCGDKADIVVFPGSKVIELRYATTV